MATLPLTQGYVAIIDDEDYERASKYSWHAHHTANGVYARAYQLGSGLKNRKLIYLHHLIAGRPPAGMVTDHINRNPLDNTRGNLRHVSYSDSLGNQSLRSDSTSGYRGVSWHAQDKLWRAQLTYKYRKVFDGLFHTPEEASAAYEAARKKLGL
jgi:hypothetical protein